VLDHLEVEEVSEEAEAVDNITMMESKEMKKPLDNFHPKTFNSIIKEKLGEVKTKLANTNKKVNLNKMMISK
jgi:hypothetical protein